MTLEVRSDVRPHLSDGRVHRMIAASGIDPPPRDLKVAHPPRQLNPTARMHADVANEVLLWLALVVPVPARMQDDDVLWLDFHLRQDVFGSDDVPVGANVRDIDDDPFVNKLRKGKVR